MRFPRKVNYCLLAVLVLVTILARYPTSADHEMGSDTTFINSLANSIVQDGYAKWILHPTSIFGLYALSYPSAAPFILSMGSEVSGISVEGLILILGMVLAIAGAISAYLLAKNIRDSDVFAHSVALLFTLAPFYVKDTTWVASSRGFVVAMLPFFLLLLARHMRTKDLRYLLLALAVFVVLSSIHRMGLLSILILIAYLLAVPLHMVTQRLRFTLAKFEKPFRYAALGISVAAFLGIFYVQFVFPGISGANVVEQYTNGALFTGSSFPVLLINMAVSLVGRVGFLLPLVPIGLFAYAWKRPKESTDKFLLLVTLTFLPLLSLRDYISEFLIPVFVILAVMGVLTIVKMIRNRRQLGAILFASFLLTSCIFSWATKDHWRESYVTDGPIPKPVYDVALYIRVSAWGTILTNAGLTGGRIAAISGLPNMPLGGASTHIQSAQQLTWNFVDPSNLAVRLMDLTQISFNTDSIYIAVNVDNVEELWETVLIYQKTGEANRIMSEYRVHFIATENDIFPTYSSYGLNRASCLLGSDPLCQPGNVLPNNSYVVYTNSEVTLWLARGGPPDR